MSGYNFDNEKHLHTLNGVALTGTSSVMSVINKPLSWWASGLACEVLGWSNPKKTEPFDRVAKANEVLEHVKSLSPADYLKLLDKAYRAHSSTLDKAATKGTNLHAELEKFVKDHMNGTLSKKYEDKIQPFIEWTQKNVKKFLWSEMYCFDEVNFIGGITDCGAELITGEIAIIDFKSSKEAYLTQFFQIAGYDIQVTKNGGYDMNGKKTFTLEKPITQHIVVPFGADEPYPVVSREIETNKQGFLNALSLYRIMNKLNNQ